MAVRLRSRSPAGKAASSGAALLSNRMRPVCVCVLLLISVLSGANQLFFLVLISVLFGADQCSFWC